MRVHLNALGIIPEDIVIVKIKKNGRHHRGGESSSYFGTSFTRAVCTQRSKSRRPPTRVEVLLLPNAATGGHVRSTSLLLSLPRLLLGL